MIARVSMPCAAFTLITTALFPVSLEGQTCSTSTCNCPITASGDAMWQTGDKVGVYIDTSIITSTSDRQGIINAVNAWSGTNGVTLTPIIQVGVPTPIPAPTGNYIQVQIGPEGQDQAYTQWPPAQGGYMPNATITFDPSNEGGGTAWFAALMSHEIGHTFGLADEGGAGYLDYSVMAKPTAATMVAQSNCDKQAAVKAYKPVNSGGGNGGEGSMCQQPCGTGCMDGMNCGDGFTPECLANTPQCVCITPCADACLSAMTCPLGGQPECEDEDEGWIPVCPYDSPIVIDAFGEGFHLTSAAGGVRFRLLPADPLQQMSWTDQRWRNGWLALDRNGNGRIDNFTDLFGNLTPQPPSSDPNGYAALAVFDDPANGGNGNGIIDPGDAVYDHLLLWIDANHNGISEPGELHHLRDVGIFAIDLHYELAWYTDQYGNRFRYKAKAWDEAGKEHDMCYDVFLTTTPRGGK